MHRDLEDGKIYQKIIILYSNIEPSDSDKEKKEKWSPTSWSHLEIVQVLTVQACVPGLWFYGRFLLLKWTNVQR